MSTEEAVEVAQADGRDFVTEEDVQATETPSKPEWLPEKYNTPEDLAKGYKELEAKLGAKEEDIRNAIIEEIQTEAFSESAQKLLVIMRFQILLIVILQMIMNCFNGGLIMHLKMVLAKKSLNRVLICMLKQYKVMHLI